MEERRFSGLPLSEVEWAAQNLQNQLRALAPDAGESLIALCLRQL
jgi:hypothetical protein